MTDYRELFHDMIVESQGTSYAERSQNINPISAAYNNGMRHGILNGITLGFRTMAEAGHLPSEIYEQWHELVYSKEMEDTQAYRKTIIKTRSERE
ncbi:hypothetical protein [Pseudomonas phage D6]|nr:hypothetical protein [Pseudomonas phage D6]